MPISHLVNCLLLTFGPYVALYNLKVSNSLFFVILTSALAYFITSALKIFILVNLQIPENIINILDYVGLYFLLKLKLISQESQVSKIIGVAIGWSLMEQICNRLFYVVYNSIGEEISWEYIKLTAEGNIHLFETIAFIALIAQKRENQVLTILIVFVKQFVVPFLFSLSGKDNSSEILISKSLFAMGILYLCKMKKFI